MDSEERLSRLCAGDVRALEDCYREHGARVYRLCLQVLAQAADAEDATQEVFLRILDRARQFDGRSSFSTWLYRLTVNLCLHRVERSRTRRALPLPPASEDPMDGGPSPLELAARRDDAARALRLLARLPVDQRLALHLREVEGLAYREIADALEVPVGTVMSRISRAREGLSRLLRPGCLSRSVS